MTDLETESIYVAAGMLCAEVPTMTGVSSADIEELIRSLHAAYRTRQ
jgi:hypothetical protein